MIYSDTSGTYFCPGRKGKRGEYNEDYDQRKKDRQNKAIRWIKTGKEGKE